MVLRAPSQCSQGALLPNVCCGGICFAVVWVTPMGLRSGEVSAVEETLCMGILEHLCEGRQ